jgi:hypothetical protein
MKSLKILGLLGAVIITAISFLSWWRSKPDAPSDEALEQGFNKHRPGLERLVAMMGEDSRAIAPTPPPESELGFSGASILRPQDVSAARWAEYEKLFNLADIKNGAIVGPNEFALVVYNWGISSGLSLAYLHCGQPDYGSLPTQPACVEKKDSGAGMYGRSKSYGYRYKKIAGDWFILQQSELLPSIDSSPD